MASSPHPPPGAAAPETSSWGTAAPETASWCSNSIWSNNSSVTRQEFTSFHNIDRRLFTRLVQSLRRDMGQSMQVMALWLWLEKTGESRQLVDCMLKWPDTLVTFLADEAVLCLNCLDTLPSSSFPPPHHHPFDIPYTHFVTRSKVSLQFFRDNRLDIITGITKIINEVCARAFEDIILQQLQEMEKNSAVFHDHNDNNNNSPVYPPNMYHNNIGVVGDQYYYDRCNQNQMVQGGGIPQCFDYQGYDVYDVEVQRQIFNNEIAGGDMFIGGIKISANQNQQQQKPEIIPQDQRTIFLTFSKGYPISETEIRDFISSKHGDCIEAIIMQERAVGEQPLYARLVLDLSCSSIEAILGGRSKAKFSINGKHVWARKYVRRNNEAPSPSPSSSPSPSPSPSSSQN
ncbi:hypothetical protein LWI28_003801 [Acer negundo]|uniref:Uncharacterized protein n=1 Tax=Acer negundo TaxID=4023 RepID=A0AAD5NG40_ACENE|nr:hypothetical protein LWI28_003801 [Acer negundo]KAK4835727.1 hypothetical protein QYF36_013699 [Acer negundo]